YAGCARPDAIASDASAHTADSRRNIPLARIGVIIGSSWQIDAMFPDPQDGRRTNRGDAAPTAPLAAGPANSYDPQVPLTVHFDHRRKWVLVRGSGAIAADEILSVIRTARTSVEYQMWPMLVDALEATTTMTDEDIEAAVEAVRQAIATGGRRGHVAIAADDDGLYARMLL